MARPLDVPAARQRLQQAGRDLEKSWLTLAMIAAGAGLLVTSKSGRRMIAPALRLLLRALNVMCSAR